MESLAKTTAIPINELSQYIENEEETILNQYEVVKTIDVRGLLLWYENLWIAYFDITRDYVMSNLKVEQTAYHILHHKLCITVPGIVTTVTSFSFSMLTGRQLLNCGPCL